MAPDPKTKQVNFRVTDDEWDVLRAIANVDETTVPNAAYEIVQAAIGLAAKDKLVQADRRNRAAARNRQSAEVVPLRGNREPRRSGA